MLGEERIPAGTVGTAGLAKWDANMFDAQELGWTVDQCISNSYQYYHSSLQPWSIQSCLILFVYEFIYLYDVLFISLQFAVPLYSLHPIFPVHYQFGHDCHWFSRSNPCKTASKASRVLHLDMNNRKQSPSIKPSSIMRGWSEVSYKGYSALDSTIDQYLQTKQWSDHRHLHQLLAL